MGNSGYGRFLIVAQKAKNEAMGIVLPPQPPHPRGPELICLAYREMSGQKLKFALTAFDPNPSEVTLAFNAEKCEVEASRGANITIEDYKLVTHRGRQVSHT